MRGKKTEKRREQMEQEKDSRGWANFRCLMRFWWLVVNELLMMFLKSSSYLVRLTQLLLLLGLCPGEAEESRRGKA